MQALVEAFESNDVHLIVVSCLSYSVKFCWINARIELEGLNL